MGRVVFSHIKKSFWSLIRTGEKEFSDAIKRGQAQGVDAVTNKLFEKATEGDNTSMIFYLKNRAGWKDKQEFLVPGGFNITIGEKDAGNL